MSDLFPLALVTGAARRLGRALAHALARRRLCHWAALSCLHCAGRAHCGRTARAGRAGLSPARRPDRPSAHRNPVWRARCAPGRTGQPPARAARAGQFGGAHAPGRRALGQRGGLGRDDGLEPARAVPVRADGPTRAWKPAALSSTSAIRRPTRCGCALGPTRSARPGWKR